MRISRGRVERMDQDHEMFHKVAGTTCQGPAECYYMRGLVDVVRNPIASKAEIEARMRYMITMNLRRNVMITGVEAHPLVCELMRDICDGEGIQLKPNPRLPREDVIFHGKDLNSGRPLKAN